ncbi:unnamed protein product [Lupinus luteus]|uniref:No apical meristem-associated C-terminal domain-containing protein n=1 Tax=Lupinus luteus TaxID=3873 RepID=A0AAV1WDN1_LUPLU
MDSISVTLKGKESTSLEKFSSKPPFFQTINHSSNSRVVDDTKKNVLSNWKQIKRMKEREDARNNLDLMKNTAGFNDNMEAMRDFEKLVRCKSRK